MESAMFDLLAQELPLPRTVSAYLDKASVLRLTLSFLHLRRVLATEDGAPEVVQLPELVSHLMPTLGGFFLLLAPNGMVVFTSENVQTHTGLTQWELMGQNALDFVHPCDHQELQEALETETDGDDRGRKRDFLIRLKCTVTDQGRVVNLKSAWWKVGIANEVVRCQGQMRTTTGTRCLLLLCEDVALPLGLAGPPQTNSFLSMHSLDLTIIHCSRSVKHLIGWEAGQLIGRSTYHLLHALDLKHIWKQHHSLLKMGRVSSGLYRMLLHTGGYVWVQTEAAVVNAHTPHIVCANHILSGPQQQGVVFSLEQLQPHHPSVVWTAETTIPNGSFLTGPPQDLRQAAGVWQEWLWPAQTRELSGMSCPEPHPYLPEGPVNGPWTQKHPATVLGVGRGLETIPSPASRALRPEAVFTVQDLDTLAPFIPMEDQDFQPHPVANPQLLQAPGGQTLSQRTSRHPLGRTWESSTQPGLKRKHRTRGNYDWASCQYDHCQGFHHQKRLKVLGELGAVRSSHCRWSPWDSWRELPGCLLDASSIYCILPVLSSNDCEINAPVHGAGLLSGSELLGALDSVILE